MMKRNLQKELEDIIKKEEALGNRPRLLLHACCGPCSSYCMEYLEKHFDLTVFFYNPNIDDTKEYKLRVEEVKRLIEEMDFTSEVKFIEGDYDPSIFHSKIKGYENEKEGGKRCDICFELRLHEAAKAAMDYGFDYFSTLFFIFISLYFAVKNRRIIVTFYKFYLTYKVHFFYKPSCLFHSKLVFFGIINIGIIKKYG